MRPPTRAVRAQQPVIARSVLIGALTFPIAMGQPLASQAVAGRLSLTPYVFQTDDGELIEAEWGRLLVPERRSNPKGRFIELAFVRFKSTSAKPGPPVIYLAGGPGGSAVDQAEWRHRGPIFQILRSVGDVVALDQRGTGRSVPNLQCPNRWNLPLDQPATRESVVSAARALASERRQFWTDRGVDLAGYTTAENADDVDDLRQALGADRMIVVGGSYGSHLGLAVIRRHGARVARAVLWSIEGPDHTLKLPSTMDEYLGKVDRLARQDARLASAVPDLLGTVRAVVERLDREPVVVNLPTVASGGSDRVVIGKYDVQSMATAVLGARDGMARLPARFAEMAKRDFSMAAVSVRSRRRASFGSAMAWHMDCASGARSALGTRHSALGTRHSALGVAVDNTNEGRGRYGAGRGDRGVGIGYLERCGQCGRGADSGAGAFYGHAECRPAAVSVHLSAAGESAGIDTERDDHDGGGDRAHERRDPLSRWAHHGRW